MEEVAREQRRHRAAGGVIAKVPLPVSVPYGIYHTLTTACGQRPRAHGVLCCEPGCTAVCVLERTKPRRSCVHTFAHLVIHFSGRRGVKRGAGAGGGEDGGGSEADCWKERRCGTRARLQYTRVSRSGHLSESHARLLLPSRPSVVSLCSRLALHCPMCQAAYEPTWAQAGSPGNVASVHRADTMSPRCGTANGGGELSQCWHDRMSGLSTGQLQLD